MSAGDENGFAFSAENRTRAEAITAKYPAGRQASAVIPLLDLAQRQNGNWLSEAAIHHVADVLDMPYIRAYEVATFYTMFNLKPVGRYHVQLCRTTPCWLRGSDDLAAVIRDRYGLADGGVTADGRFSLQEVECLGACVNAPVVQINDDYYEDLDAGSLAGILDALERDETPPPGSAIRRQGSAPATGPTTLGAPAPDAGEP